MTSVPGSGRIIRLVRITAGLAAVVFVAVAVVDRWDEVRDQLSRVGLGALAVSEASLLCATAALLFSWRAILADLGSPLGIRPAARVMLLGQLGKYVPGSVWSVMAQAELANDLGVPRRRGATAGLVFNAVVLGVGLLIAAMTLPVLLTSGDVPGWAAWAVLLGPLALVALVPGVLTRLANLGLHLLRRQPLEHPFTWRGTLLAAGWTMAFWFFSGVHIWVLGLRLGADPVDLLVPAFGGFAAAWSVGFVVIFAPAGAGVRDALLVVILASALPGGATAALTVALVSRLLFVVADVAAALVGHLLGRSRRTPQQVAGRLARG